MAEAKKTTVKDPMLEMVKVNIPKERGADAPKTMDLWLNGQHLEIPLGKEVEIPKPFKEIIDNKLAMEEEADKFNEEHGTV